MIELELGDETRIYLKSELQTNRSHRTVVILNEELARENFAQVGSTEGVE
jgi:hypothetical protein